jgi:hypothetical protein
MSLITKDDIALELQITIPSGYTTAMMTTIVDYADDMLKMKTKRASFTGNAEGIATYAELCIAIDRMATSNRDLMKTAIESISENGASIKFSNGKTLDSYRTEANMIIKDLALKGTRDSTIIFADPSDEHTGDEGSVFY